MNTVCCRINKYKDPTLGGSWGAQVWVWALLGSLPTLLGANSTGAIPSTAMQGPGLWAAGHGISGSSGFILRHSPSLQGHQEQVGQPGWHCFGESGSFQLAEERQCGTNPRRCTWPYLRPPCVIIFFFAPSLGLTSADKLALISQNVILQLRAKSSQVLRLNSFSKPSLH